MSAARAKAVAPPFDLEVAWHDVECGGYTADLSLWRELAADAGGPILDLGAGTGRVALDLAARGHAVTALDADAALVRECGARARKRGLPVNVVCQDARSLALGRRYALAIAPMQVVQLLGGAGGRAALLERMLAHLEPGARFAAALADPLTGAPVDDSLPPLPDVGRVAGWTLESKPVAMREEASERGAGERTIAIDRLRRAVAPDGEASESLATVALTVFDPDDLGQSGVARGFGRLGDRHVPETEAYVGSTVVVLEAPAERA